MEPFLYAAIILVVCVLMVAGMEAAYNNGVTDGYGYSKEPTCPGYAKAGRYLKKYMAHRWPELVKNAPVSSEPVKDYPRV